jgi:hypothetical protein
MHFINVDLYNFEKCLHLTLEPTTTTVAETTTTVVPTTTTVPDTTTTTEPTTTTIAETTTTMEPTTTTITQTTTTIPETTTTIGIFFTSNYLFEMDLLSFQTYVVKMNLVSEFLELVCPSFNI